MRIFNTNNKEYRIIIRGDSESGPPYTDPVTGDQDTVRLDVIGNQIGFPSVYNNVRITDLIDALNTIEGVTATYEKPRNRVGVPTGIGAIVSPSNRSAVKLIRVFPASTGRRNWIQNLHGSHSNPEWYTDAQVYKYLNENDYVIAWEGIQQ